MTEAAARAQQAPERAAAQAVTDSVQNFAPPEKSTTWSDVASQCWTGDVKDCTSAIGKTLRESLGFGNSEKQKELEETGVLPRTRISDSNAYGKSPQFTVEWGEKPLQNRAGDQRRAGERRAEGEEGTRPKPERAGNKSEQSGQTDFLQGPRPAETETDQLTERHRPGRRNRDGSTDRTNGRNGDRNTERDRTGVKVDSEGELGKVYELKLDHNTGRHKVDASVIVPKGYDP